MFKLLFLSTYKWNRSLSKNFNCYYIVHQYITSPWFFLIFIYTSLRNKISALTALHQPHSLHSYRRQGKINHRLVMREGRKCFELERREKQNCKSQEKEVSPVHNKGRTWWIFKSSLCQSGDEFPSFCLSPSSPSRIKWLPRLSQLNA